MNCRITLRLASQYKNRGLYCDVHRSEGMSSICDVAEQELRETIVQLQKSVEMLQAKIVEMGKWR